MERRAPLTRTPFRAKIRRDCKVCRHKVEKRPDGSWKHVSKLAVDHTPEPYKTKRTPKRTSLMRQADALWSQIVKADGQCAVLLVVTPYPRPFVVCSGTLEAAHVVPRRHRSVRWDPANGRALCHAHHRYFTDHEKAWRDFIGPEWDRLWEKAQTVWDKDYTQVIARLRAELATMKAAA